MIIVPINDAANKSHDQDQNLQQNNRKRSKIIHVGIKKDIADGNDVVIGDEDIIGNLHETLNVLKDPQAKQRNLQNLKRK